MGCEDPPRVLERARGLPHAVYPSPASLIVGLVAPLALLGWPLCPNRWASFSCLICLGSWRRTTICFDPSWAPFIAWSAALAGSHLLFYWVLRRLEATMYLVRQSDKTRSQSHDSRPSRSSSHVRWKKLVNYDVFLVVAPGLTWLSGQTVHDVSEGAWRKFKSSVPYGSAWTTHWNRSQGQGSMPGCERLSVECVGSAHFTEQIARVDEPTVRSTKLNCLARAMNEGRARKRRLVMVGTARQRWSRKIGTAPRGRMGRVLA